MWNEVSKSKEAPGCARRLLDKGADLIFVWGGDGTVHRCADALAGSGATIAILPAGTANLLATNLGVPKDIRAAVRVLAGAPDPRRAGPGLESTMRPDDVPVEVCEPVQN